MELSEGPALSVDEVPSLEPEYVDPVSVKLKICPHGKRFMSRFWKDLVRLRWFFEGTNPFRLEFVRVENPRTLQVFEFAALAEISVESPSLSDVAVPEVVGASSTAVEVD